MSTKLEGFDFWRDTLGSPKYVVAPMVDASELAWRMLSRRYGAQLCYTPMLHSNVFQRDPGYRKEALATCEGDKPLIVQFCANDPDILLKAAKLAEDHCDAIDLNLGCPQQIARRGHYGAFLQDEWELIAKMISVCHAELKVPITAKMRVFKDIEKTVRYAQMLEKAGCQLLTVHGRTREMKGMDTGLANWEHIKAVRENVKIPVFANGNIQYLHDVERCIEETGVQGVMSAEGNLFNPGLFHGIRPPCWKMSLEYLDLVEKYPCPMSYIRGHIFKIMVHALNKHKDLREDIGSAKEVSQIRRTVEKVRDASQPDVDIYNAEPEDYIEANNLSFPYWMCQPYVRPTPLEREERQRERQKKEKAALEYAQQKRGLDEDEVSKNKLKKIKRNPVAAFKERKGRDHYEKCENGCGNIRGMNCRYNWCKLCCRKECFKEIVDCVGHRTMVKSKQEKRLAWEAQQRALAENANNENIDAQNRAQTATTSTTTENSTASGGNSASVENSAANEIVMGNSTISEIVMENSTAMENSEANSVACESSMDTSTFTKDCNNIMENSACTKVNSEDSANACSKVNNVVNGEKATDNSQSENSVEDVK